MTDWECGSGWRGWTGGLGWTRVDPFSASKTSGSTSHAHWWNAYPRDRRRSGGEPDKGGREVGTSGWGEDTPPRESPSSAPLPLSPRAPLPPSPRRAALSPETNTQPASAPPRRGALVRLQCVDDDDDDDDEALSFHSPFLVPHDSVICSGRGAPSPRANRVGRHSPAQNARTKKSPLPSTCGLADERRAHVVGLAAGLDVGAAGDDPAAAGELGVRLLLGGDAGVVLALVDAVEP
jgi:hypothetical protein